MRRGEQKNEKQYVGSGQRDSSVSAAADRGRAGSGTGSRAGGYGLSLAFAESGRMADSCAGVHCRFPAENGGMVCCTAFDGVGRRETCDMGADDIRSGIPQLEGEMSGKLDQTWWKVLPAKFCGGFLCLLGGLSLGREGPSIQLGAMAGKALSRLASLGKSEEKYLLTCGASAGLAAAFHAPLAGVLFSLEEIHKNFSVSVLISVMTASVTADCVASAFLGRDPVFQFQIQGDLPMQYFWMVLLLGLVLGVFGAFYNWFTLKAQELYQRAEFLNTVTRLFLPFLAAECWAIRFRLCLAAEGI